MSCMSKNGQNLGKDYVGNTYINCGFIVLLINFLHSCEVDLVTLIGIETGEAFVHTAL